MLKVWASLGQGTLRKGLAVSATAHLAAGFLLAELAAGGRMAAEFFPRQGTGEFSITLAAAPPGLDVPEPSPAAAESQPIPELSGLRTAHVAEAPRQDDAVAAERTLSTPRMTPPVRVTVEPSEESLVSFAAMLPTHVRNDAANVRDGAEVASSTGAAPRARSPGHAIDASVEALPGGNGQGTGDEGPRGVAGGKGTNLDARSAVASPGGGGGQDKSPPVFNNNTLPVYPPEARLEGRQGTVMLRIWVSTSGWVTRVEILESSGSADLDDSAVRAVSRWRGQPALRKGVPIETVELLPVRFVLR